MKLKQRLVVAITLIIFFKAIYLILHVTRYSSNEPILVREVPGNQPDVGFHKQNPKNSKSEMNEAKQFDNAVEENQSTKVFFEAEMERLRLNFHSPAVDVGTKAFQIAASWVGERQIYPKNHPELSSILKLMATERIVKADVLPKGTQIKLLLVLEGGQKVVFKQKRYTRDHIIEGKPYDGYDRHNAEIAAFHLDRILEFRRAPLVVGRVVNLKTEIIPVATKDLLQTFRFLGNAICYFGKCLYCNEKNMVCADGEVLEGSVTLWLPDEWTHFVKQRHPYQRTYIDGRSAKWEVDESYCDTIVKHKAPYDKGPRLLDVTDGAVFDYLIGNADRHHYETFKDRGPNVMMLMLDNAKSFGNPYFHEPSILAPIRQCCILRNSTWNKLHQLKNGVLSQLMEAAMSEDPIAPVLHPSHLNAMDVRLPTVVETVQKCIDRRGEDKVLMNEWTGV